MTESQGGIRSEGGHRTDSLASGEVTRSGFVAVAGRPNSGKSTLLNALAGASLAAVSPRGQTTVRTTRGLLTTDSAQFVLLDLPGLLKPRDLLQATLLKEARAGMTDGDVLLLVVDGTTDPRGAQSLLEELGPSALRLPLLVALNKRDRMDERAVTAWGERLAQAAGAVRVIPISAVKGDGLDDLLEALEELLPEGPFLYPEDEIATQPVRKFMAEIVRETVFEEYREEVPHATWASTEEFRDASRGGRTFVQVTLWVERASQKGILLGRGGTAIRRLGMRSREKMESFLGGPVYLDLWVKVLPGWRRKRAALRRLGFDPPAEGDEAKGKQGVRPPSGMEGG